ncbi:substrate-binding domain-containing protein [Microvirga tunisiensis]|uniref:Substrate-binding domain-containing protein n=2 Tax=Microvirga tunisiensis TaxID=2108360 RepID=A0A5N7MAL2_9HYPH|nr:substrate-binding domain-containing protein [Microvirga tunisiensis]MPR23708.1 substrate-binding domain-containing protein [Microvirga tunisiensis]
MSTNDGSSMKPGRITLHDVAAAAGVSKSSVSRILDERLPRSESESAKRVRQVAAELGYVRDISAASLRRGNTSTIGVVVPHLTDTVMAMFYEAVARACQKAGLFAIVVATSRDEPEADRAAAETLLARGVDGLILTTAQLGEKFTQELQLRNIPFVLALRRSGNGLASVGDDTLGGYLATRHLLDLGHRKIGIIAGLSYSSSSSDRLIGYRKAMDEAGAEIADGWVVPSGFDIESGAEAAAKLISHPDRPTAIFAVNDNTAIGAMSWLPSAGLSVPGDISIVGYNDIPIVRHLAVPLTTVRVPFDQIATGAIELLRSTTLGPNDRIRIATPTLIPRRSTARNASKDV